MHYRTLWSRALWSRSSFAITFDAPPCDITDPRVLHVAGNEALLAGSAAERFAVAAVYAWKAKAAATGIVVGAGALGLILFSMLA